MADAAVRPSPSKKMIWRCPNCKDVRLEEEGASGPLAVSSVWIAASLSTVTTSSGFYLSIATIFRGMLWRWATTTILGSSADGALSLAMFFT